MDVRRVTAAGGVLAALLVAAVLPASFAVVAAGAAAAVIGTTVDRGAGGLVVASLAVAATVVLSAVAVASAPSAAAAFGSLFAVAGLAGCLAAGAATVAPAREHRIPALGTYGGRAATLLGGWTALVLAGTAVLALLTASAQPFGSLLGARLAIPGLAPVLLAVPVAVAAIAGWAALGAWREAGLPPFLLGFGPAALLVGWAVVSLPASGAFDALLAGQVVDAPVAYVLLWATATVLVASALAGAVAAEDPRFRRGPAWAAAAVGPLALGAFVAATGGGTLLRAALTAVPPAAGPFGSVIETADAATATAFLAVLSVAALALLATLPARSPLLGRVTAGRPAGVGAACLLVAVALASLGVAATVLAGGLAVLSWVLLAGEPSVAPTVAPPPRTALSKAGTATLAVGAGGVLAVSLVGLVPQSDPGVGGALLLVGVATLGLAMR